jgi:CHAT domain-containing protein/Tfp pilus assembly protein PilF
MLRTPKHQVPNRPSSGRKQTREIVRVAIRIVPPILALACLTACHRQGDPQVSFGHAERALQQGDILTATREAEKGYVDFHNVSPEWAWKFTILRATVRHWRGMNDEVISLLASEPAPAPSGELTIKRQSVESVAYSSLHKFREAEQKLQEAERLCVASDYPSCADVISTRGKLEMGRGHYAPAQILFQRVLASSRARGDQFREANAFLDLSWSADEQTHFDEALDWADAARQISLAQDFADIAQTALGNTGWAYYKLGDPEKAEVMFAEAEQQAEKLGDSTDQVRWLLDVGYVYLDTRSFAAAERSYRRSLDLAEKLKSREDIINALQALAFISEQTGKLEEAKHYAAEALAMARADGNGRDIVYPRLVQGHVAAQQHDTAAAEGAFREVAQSKDSPVFLKWEAERSLARLYEDENHPDSADRGYQSALSTFETARSELQHEDSRLPFLTNASRIYDDYIHFLVSQGKTSQALQVAEYSRGRTLAEGLGVLRRGTSFKPDPLNAEEIARRAGGTILFYWLGEKQSYLWTITPQKTTLAPLPPASEIDASVQRFRKALTGPQDVLETANGDGSSLFRILVAPAKGLLAKNSKVFIIPDGSLNGLNFETLLVSDPKPHYWIEDVTIANASSLRLLSASHTATRKYASNLLLFGDAVAPNKDYPELSKAAVEMDNIQKHFPGAQQKVFNRNQATPPAYLASQPERFSYIHFVAHGTASRLSPLDSAIVLSKATAEEDSFKLYARDIIHHPLRAELVTISTCYGAGSRAYSGEGMVGLSWAFLRAGAHNVVGALWEVSDASTAQLMDQLYSELKKGKSPDAALRAAKLSLLMSGGAFRRPFYWAPFQLFTGS